MINRRAFGKALGAGVAGTAAATQARLFDASAAAATTAGHSVGSASAVGRTEGRTSFDSVKQVKAGELDIGYAESGPAHGPVVILLHGWPYDIHSYVDVAPLLAAEGYRVIVPYLRGYGSTRFLSAKTFRDGEQVATGLDLIALMDALKIQKALLGGFDWGARTADVVAALWPGRCKALVSVSGDLIVNQKQQQQPTPPAAERAFWYQYYFTTARGERGLTKYRHDLAKLIWHDASPTWHFDDATFDRTAAAFDNPDYVRIVIHNYRWRLGLAKGNPRYAGVQAKLAAEPAIAVPTVTLDGALDPFVPPGNGSAYRKKFTGPYIHRRLEGIGHNLPQEAPQPFAQAVMDADRL
ncbi:alpha/beta hydrolase [Streptomyces sp. NPDC048281]|uniref:alpha/beta fold hydrolase n=1 Tax=Streptomyces sp. NPDC048281 TaxID=3154715 RepID=UPI0034470FA5